MRVNNATVAPVRTYEGAPAVIPKAPHQLERQVAACMLWEDTFYAKGSEIAKQIADTAAKVPVGVLAATAIKAREEFKLRHVPLYLLAHLNKRRDESPGLLAATVERVVQRADELAELLAIVQKVEGGTVKECMSHGLAKGLAKAFTKFNAYQLAKYDRANKIRLRDVLFLTHAKPKNKAQAKDWKKMVDGKLPVPDTWEVALSTGKDKRKTWERLLKDEKLGYMALLRNLRNMTDAGVDQSLVEQAITAGAPKSRALPFRFISAAKHAPAYAQCLSDAMLTAIDRERRMDGLTVLLVDVSGSMDTTISDKSELLRWEAASAVAVLAREICERARVFTFSDQNVEVQNLRGIPLIAGIANSQPHSSTMLAQSLHTILNLNLSGLKRVIVFTDEQSHDGNATLTAGVRGYIVNVASHTPALQTGKKWVRVNGFSERIIDWIRYEESADAES